MKLSINAHCLSLALLIAAAPYALSQDGAAPAAEEKIDIEARKRSVVNLEEHIKDREDRLASVAQSIMDLDARVEKGIDKIVTRLKETSDSKDSQVRVAQTKQNAIEGLRKTIEYYVKKRDEAKAQLLKGSGVPKEDLESDVKIFDERIEKRIGQVVGLTKSFTEYKELDKYEESTSSSWGWGWTERRISDDWRLNNKEVRHTEAQTKEIADRLKESITRLERDNSELAENLKSKTLSEEGRAYYQKELDNNKSVIGMRQAQLESLLSKSGDEGKPEAVKVSRSEAHSMQLAIEDMAKDLREDFFSIFEHYAELNRQREQLAKLKANLQARKDWIKDFEAKG